MPDVGVQSRAAGLFFEKVSDGWYKLKLELQRYAIACFISFIKSA